MVAVEHENLVSFTALT